MSYNVLDVCRYVIKYSNENDYGISNLKLQKILYFIQAYFLLKRKITLHALVRKLKHGILDLLFQKLIMNISNMEVGIYLQKSYIMFDKNDIWNSKRIEFEDTTIADKDKALIDKVIDKFADYSATDLVSLTHRQSPWIDAYVPYQHNEITINAIREYFDS